MSDAGKEILESTRKFRRYLEDIGKLLSTAEEMLEKQGFQRIDGSQAVDQRGRADIGRPGRWFPQDAFRFLTHEKNKRLLVVISVIMDDIDRPDSLDQPIVSAAWLECTNGANDRRDELSRIIFILEPPKRDESMIEIPPEEIKKFPRNQIKGDILSSQALAVPLIDIVGPKEIKEKIITPLMESLKTNSLLS